MITLEKDTGSALMIVLLVSAVLITITTGLITALRVNTRLILSESSEIKAVYLAEAGLAMAEEALYVDPYTRGDLGGQLSTGRFSAKIRTDCTMVDHHTLLVPVEGVGYSGSSRQTLFQRFAISPFPMHESFRYAIFQTDTTIPLLAPPGVQIYGDIFINGHFHMDINCAIDGIIFTSGVDDNDQLDPLGLNCATVFKPEQRLANTDWDWVGAMATETLHGPSYVNSIRSGELVFVYGDATVAGDCQGGAAVFATGELTIADDTTSDDTIYLSAKKEITVNGTCNLTAILYSPGQINFLGPTHVEGVIAAGAIGLAPDMTIRYLDPFPTSLPMPLPGLTIRKLDWHHKHFTPKTH